MTFPSPVRDHPMVSSSETMSAQFVMTQRLRHPGIHCQRHPGMEFRNPLRMTVGQRIVEARKAKGWSRRDLVASSGIPYSTLAGLEVGDQKSSTAIPALASALDVHALWLAENHGPKSFSGGSQNARFDDVTMAQAVELLYLMADARPEDKKFRRFNWAMILLAAKGIHKADGDPRKAMAMILTDLAEEI